MIPIIIINYYITIIKHLFYSISSLKNENYIFSINVVSNLESKYNVSRLVSMYCVR